MIEADAGQVIHVSSLNVAQPSDLPIIIDLDWTIYHTLGELEKELLDDLDTTYHLCILTIEQERFFNEILVALKLRNKGISVVICTDKEFPKEIVKDVLSFFARCVSEGIQVRAEVLLDEHALDLVDEEEMKKVIRYFENEML